MAEPVVQQLERLSLARPTNYVGKIEGKSTIFEMSIVKGSSVWRYDVEITKTPADPTKKEKIYTKQNEAALRTTLKMVCGEIMEAAHTKTNGFGVDAKYVYDGKCILFTTKEVQIKGQSIRLQANDLPEHLAIFTKGEPVVVKITPNERVQKLDYSDLQAALVADVSVQADRSTRTFLEILTSQFLVNTKAYQYVSAGTLFERQTTPLVPGMQMRVGVKKGVRVTAEPGKPTAFLVLDMKRTAFIAHKRLSDVYLEMVRNPGDNRGKRDFEKLIKGIRCVVTYDRSKMVLLGFPSRNSIDDREYFVRGQSIPQYMQTQKNIRLQHLKIPGIHPDQPGGRKIIYPMEVLEVVEGQVVPIEKLHKEASKKLLLENSVQPNLRFTYASQQASKIGTGAAANFLKNFGVSINVNSNDIDINRRVNEKQMPRIIVGGGKVTPQANGAWFKDATDAKFIVPSTKLKKWMVVYDAKVHNDQIKAFVQNLIKKANAAGMPLPAPQEVRKESFYNLQSAFEHAQKMKYQFIFFIDDEYNDSHGALKLYEAYYKILSQHVIVKNLSAGPQTIKNIAMKLNTKCFGINFIPEERADMKDFSLENDDLLIIGLDVSHPQKLGAKDRFDLKKKYPELTNKHPSVVGVCANKMTSKWGMAGDYFYQQSRRESISPTRLRKAIYQLAEMTKAANRSPARVIVFRDGLSEGQQQQAVAEEFAAVKAGVKDSFPNLDSKCTFIVATKDHSKRFYRTAGGQIVNTAVGDVVDSKVVRTDVPEFYQQNHHPLKGVPKMMQVDILTNELNMPMDKIQHLMYALSNMHQICACPTSLPLPIYLAKECAKRGMANYNTLYAMRFPTHRNQQPSDFTAAQVKAMDGMLNFDDLTEVLSYSGCRLGGTRFNA